MTAKEFDFVVIGGGTNGLTTACYLAKAGVKPLVLERLDKVGGGAITREITLPGFKHDVFATSLNLFKAGPLVEDLNLSAYGLKEALPDPISGTPFPDGSGLFVYRELNKTLRSVENVSKKDASNYRKLYEFYLANKELIIGGLYAPPPPLSVMVSECEKTEEGQEFLRLSFMSARDYLDENFESEEVKAWLVLWAVNHIPYAPEEPGSALFMIAFAGVIQEYGCGVPIGGIATVADSLVRFIQKHGGNVEVDSEVKKILIKDDHAVGVQLKNGKTIYSRKGIAANTEPKSLFLNLVGEECLEPSFVKRVRRYRFPKAGEVMIHAALDEWLDYRPPEAQKTGIIQIGYEMKSISRAYNQCVNGVLPEEPPMTIDCVTMYDHSRAPLGKHILWDFVRAPVFLQNQSWDDVKEEFADRCVEVLSRFAPNARQAILKRVVLSPVDIERLNPNMVSGDTGSGQESLDQTLAFRPFVGYSQYRTPIKGLYMCGAHCHPGGGVSGAPGYNAATIILSDLRKTGTNV